MKYKLTFYQPPCNTIYVVQKVVGENFGEFDKMIFLPAKFQIHLTRTSLTSPRQNSEMINSPKFSLPLFRIIL